MRKLYSSFVPGTFTPYPPPVSLAHSHPDCRAPFRFLPPGENEAAHHGASCPFLGFTHYWGRSRTGKWIVKRKTASDRLTRALQAVSTLVQSSPACTAVGTAAGAAAQAVGPLLVLRAHWKPALNELLSGNGETHMDEVAESPRRPAPQLGDICPVAGAVPAAGRARRPFHLPRSEHCGLSNRVRQSRSHGSVGAWGG